MSVDNKKHKLYASKLERGPYQTLAYKDSSSNWQLYETASFVEQLSICQRYFVRKEYVDNNTLVTLGQAYDTTKLYTVIALPQTMRIKPTITMSGNFQIYAKGDTASLSHVGGFSGNEVSVVFNGSGLTIGGIYYLENVAKSYIDFSAEL